MTQKRLKTIESQIAQLKQELSTVGEMRPGSLTPQRRKGCQHGAYYQLSYTHRMQGRTEYVRAEFAPIVKAQTETFRHFKKLVTRWSALALKHAKLKMDLMKKGLIS
jgi:hypothetical protein